MPKRTERGTVSSMVEDAQAGEIPAVDRCPWCSGVLPAPDAATCPSCGATLISTGDSDVPGLTAIDMRSLSKAAQAAARQPRSRFLSWLSGSYVEEPARHEPGVLSPPDGDVRREMHRLELEAHIANLKAENDALTAAAMTEAQHGAAAPVAPETPVADAPDEADADAEDDRTA